MHFKAQSVKCKEIFYLHCSWMVWSSVWQNTDTFPSQLGSFIYPLKSSKDTLFWNKMLLGFNELIGEKQKTKNILVPLQNLGRKWNSGEKITPTKSRKTSHKQLFK